MVHPAVLFGGFFLVAAGVTGYAVLEIIREQQEYQYDEDTIFRHSHDFDFQPFHEKESEDAYTSGRYEPDHQDLKNRKHKETIKETAEELEQTDLTERKEPEQTDLTERKEEPEQTDLTERKEPEQTDSTEREESVLTEEEEEDMLKSKQSLLSDHHDDSVYHDSNSSSNILDFNGISQDLANQIEDSIGLLEQQQQNTSDSDISNPFYPESIGLSDSDSWDAISTDDLDPI
ncbi:hypothetical protein BD560DRAFT_394624 [Blakeslea trispora]|nr:hypothetical protein BD560DRAFT_394624 [Blakeslea trispora]